MNKEDTHFLTFINNVKAFPRFDDMAGSYNDLKISASKGTDKPKGIGFIETSKTQFVRNDLNNTRNNMKS